MNVKVNHEEAFEIANVLEAALQSYGRDGRKVCLVSIIAALRVLRNRFAPEPSSAHKAANRDVDNWVDRHVTIGKPKALQ